MNNRSKRKNPVKIKKVELQYRRSLTKVADYVAHVIDGFTRGTALANIDNLAIDSFVDHYIKSLIPWATKTAFDFVGAIAIQDAKAWKERSKEISVELKREIRDTDIGDAMRDMVHEQVELIKSIPIKAAERVHRICLKGLEDGTRSEEFIEEIMRTGQVTRNRARSIARTESGRTSARFVRLRAEKIGSDSYIWRTSKDSDVRLDHKRLEGQVFKFKEPPLHDDGHRYNPGEFCECRCYAEVIIKD